MENEELKKDQELRAAMREVYWPATRLAVAGVWGRRVNMTAEEFINTEIDNLIDSGLGEVFKIFRTNHGHYPALADMQRALKECRGEQRV